MGKSQEIRKIKSHEINCPVLTNNLELKTLKIILASPILKGALKEYYLFNHTPGQMGKPNQTSSKRHSLACDGDGGTPDARGFYEIREPVLAKELEAAPCLNKTM